MNTEIVHLFTLLALIVAALLFIVQALLAQRRHRKWERRLRKARTVQEMLALYRE